MCLDCKYKSIFGGEELYVESDHDHQRACLTYWFNWLEVWNLHFNVDNGRRRMAGALLVYHSKGDKTKPSNINNSLP